MKTIFLALIAISIYGCSPKPAAVSAPPPPSLPVASIVSGTDTTYQEYPASIEGTINVGIRPQVSGSLDKVFVDEGAYVTEGTPLFKINESLYRAQYNNAVAMLHTAEANVLTSQLEIDKVTPLVSNKVVSE